MNPFATALPQIPGCLLHTMYELRVSGGYSKGQGGQFVPTPEARVPFEGAVLPVSDKDLQRSPQGTFSARSEKIYTNGHSLQEGGQVFDPQTGTTYTITKELGHNSIHPMKRYVVEAKGGAAAK